MLCQSNMYSYKASDKFLGLTPSTETGFSSLLVFLTLKWAITPSSMMCKNIKATSIMISRRTNSIRCQSWMPVFLFAVWGLLHEGVHEQSLNLVIDDVIWIITWKCNKLSKVYQQLSQIHWCIQIWVTRFESTAMIILLLLAKSVKLHKIIDQANGWYWLWMQCGNNKSNAATIQQTHANDY